MPSFKMPRRPPGETISKRPNSAVLLSSVSPPPCSLSARDEAFAGDVTVVSTTALPNAPPARSHPFSCFPLFCVSFIFVSLSFCVSFIVGFAEFSLAVVNVLVWAPGDCNTLSNPGVVCTFTTNSGDQCVCVEYDGFSSHSYRVGSACQNAAAPVQPQMPSTCNFDGSSSVAPMATCFVGDSVPHTCNCVDLPSNNRVQGGATDLNFAASLAAAATLVAATSAMTVRGLSVCGVQFVPKASPQRMLGATFAAIAISLFATTDNLTLQGFIASTTAGESNPPPAWAATTVPVQGSLFVTVVMLAPMSGRQSP